MRQNYPSISPVTIPQFGDILQEIDLKEPIMAKRLQLTPKRVRD